MNIMGNQIAFNVSENLRSFQGHDVIKNVKLFNNIKNNSTAIKTIKSKLKYYQVGFHFKSLKRRSF